MTREPGWLRAHVLRGLVGAPAAACVGWALTHLGSMPSSVAVPATATAMIAVGAYCTVPLGTGSRRPSSLACVAILVVALMVPPAWVIVCTVLGVGVVRATTRDPRPGRFRRAVWGTSAVTLTAAAASMVVSLFDIALSREAGFLLSGVWTDYAWALVTAGLICAVLEDLTSAVLAAADGARIKPTFGRETGMRWLARAAALLGVMVSVAMLTVDAQLAVAVPTTVLVACLAGGHRIRLKHERHVWQRLAAVTDDLHHAADLMTVLHVAVRGIVDVMDADWVEAEVWGIGPRRLVRATKAGIVHDGPPGQALAVEGDVFRCPIGNHGPEPVGMLRLRTSSADLATGVHGMLRAYGSALATAIGSLEAHTGLTDQAQRATDRAQRDPLTTLLNREGLLREVNRWLRRGGIDQVAVLFVDFNGFKAVNDSFGHAVGDQLLINVARRLGAAARAHGAVAARLGGDEFGLLLTVPARRVAGLNHAARILACLDEPFDIDHMKINLRASSGLAVARPGVDADGLLHLADLAMYRSKRGGIPVIADTDTVDGVDRRRALVADLPAALASGEVTVRLVPIVEMNSGQVVSCEAVAFWAHPEHGAVEPGMWTDLVDLSNQAAAFAESVVDQALAAARQLRSGGLEFPVAVNVPAQRLLDSHFPHTVLAQLRIHDLQPDDLVLSFSETAGISRLEIVDQVVANLRRAGVRLGIDHFGAGRESLSILSRLPVQELTIAASVVEDMDTRSQSMVVVQAAVKLGQQLGLTVRAAGVHTRQQRRLLLKRGCRTGQGRLFADAMSPHDLIQRLTADHGSATFVEPLNAGEPASSADSG